MSKDSGMGDLLKYGLLAVGGYLLYQNFIATPAAAVASTAPPATGSTTGTSSLSLSDLVNAIKNAVTPTPAATTTPPPASTTTASPAAAATLSAQLVTAAKDNTFFIAQNGQGNADEWNFYLAQLRPPGLSADQFAAIFPGMTATDRGPVMSADAFVSKIQAGGVGLGAVQIPVPLMFSNNGKRVIVWANRTMTPATSRYRRAG